MKAWIHILSCLGFFILFIACEDEIIPPNCDDQIAELRLNDYQTIGSHNSYRIKTTAEILALVNILADTFPDEFEPASWDYGQESILDQLDLFGMRSLELDVYRDPQGGLFYNRLGNSFVNLDIESGIPELLNPGLKVLHFPDFDYNTHYYTFVGALTYLKSWSESNPNHLALTVLVEAKEDSPDVLIPGNGLTATFPFEGNSVEEIESEIENVFGLNSNQLLMPSEVKQSYSTLREAVLNKSWPKINEVRGKIIFVLMARDEVVDNYVMGHPSLEGRSMFVFTDAEKEESAFLKIDNPIENLQLIKDRVSQGFIVRTRADAETIEARTGDYNRMNRAFESGAQLISTDYYRADPRYINSSHWTDYMVQFPDEKIAMINHNILNPETLDCPILE